jgi:hypothetical protein
MALQARHSNLVGTDFRNGADRWQQLFTRPTFLAYLRRTRDSALFRIASLA